MIEQLNASGTATARYTQGLGIDEPLEVYEGHGSYYYHADALGSVVALTKSNGSAANTYFGYNTFGAMPVPSETVANPFRFTGREWDSEINLYYYRARYYDPLFGRFLSEDPAGLETGLTPYAYVYNNPCNLIDPFGLQACCPKKAEEEIRGEIQKVRNILNRLEGTGTALGAAPPRAAGLTGCSHPRIRSTGQELPAIAMTHILVDKNQHPCQYKCAEAHEAVHRRQCEHLTPHAYGRMNEAQREIPAYTMELGCYLYLLQSAGLNMLF